LIFSQWYCFHFTFAIRYEYICWNMHVRLLQISKFGLHDRLFIYLHFGFECQWWSCLVYMNMMNVPGHGCHVIFLIGDKNTISVINLLINIHTNIDIPTGVSKWHNFVRYNTNKQMLQQPLLQIRVITKLPNSEQSYKGKVKTHKYKKQTKSVNNRKTVKTVMTLTWYRHF
jgi:hypothetical protein